METGTLSLDFDKIFIQPLSAAWLLQKEVKLDVLRLDMLHPVVSGNKWFKLKYYLHEAQQLNKQSVATFGGAYSNHIAATAFACKAFGLQSIGFIRGEQAEAPSQTLKQAENYGMKLVFISREQYKQKEQVADEFAQFNWYWIAEGGYGSTGARGASEILQHVEHNHYTHILASVGTGTMLAGLIMSANASQQITGISSMKGNAGLEQEIKNLLPDKFKNRPFSVLHNYHFGGYGKKNNELIAFMEETNHDHELPLDFVYTAKLFFAIKDLTHNNYFAKGSSILMIHSGGLQGNASLRTTN